METAKKQLDFDMRQKRIEKRIEIISKCTSMKAEEISDKIRRDNDKANRILRRNNEQFMDRQEEIKRRYNQLKDSTWLI